MAKKRRLAGSDASISPRERQHLKCRVRMGQERLRRRYREVHGKIVDWITHYIEDGTLYVNVRFQDHTDFSLQFGPQIVIDGVDLSDMKSGDSKLIREYYRRRGR